MAKASTRKKAAAGRTRRQGYKLEDILKTEGGVLRVGGARGIVMTQSAFTYFQQVVNEQMPELMAFGFYEMGYRAGLDFAEHSNGAGGTPEDAFRFFVEVYKQAGYGDIEVVEFDLAERMARVRGRNLVETAVASQGGIYRSPRAACHYSRGMLAGRFSRILGAEVICEELACEHRGDAACEFTILPYGGGAD